MISETFENSSFKLVCSNSFWFKELSDFYRSGVNLNAFTLIFSWNSLFLPLSFSFFFGLITYLTISAIVRFVLILN